MEKGLTYHGTVTFESARYVTDYVLKKYNGRKATEEYGDKQIPFCLMSKGLGKQFVMENQEYLNAHQGFTVKGQKVGLPRYYQDKMDINKQQIKQDAIEHAQKMLAMYQNKGIIDMDDLEYSFLKAREKTNKQAELNLEAKCQLFEGML